MRIITPSVEIIDQPSGLEGIYQMIELAGRTCYKSEDKITETSAQEFVNRMIESKQAILLLQKSAIEKLLQSKSLFTPRSGLCSLWYICLIKRIITPEEASVFRELLRNYRVTHNIKLSDYFWDRGDWIPREAWLRESLEDINKQLEVYGERIIRKKKSSLQETTEQ